MAICNLGLWGVHSVGKYYYTVYLNVCYRVIVALLSSCMSVSVELMGWSGKHQRGVIEGLYQGCADYRYVALMSGQFCTQSLSMKGAGRNLGCSFSRVIIACEFSECFSVISHGALAVALVWSDFGCTFPTTLKFWNLHFPT